VSLFLNGSTTAYATFTYSPTTSFATYTFDFTDLTVADVVTLATFRFYGWNAPSSGQLGFDNVATSGLITAVPELAPVWGIFAFGLCVTVENAARCRQKLAAKI
jgi:hypothetical protein